MKPLEIAPPPIDPGRDAPAAQPSESNAGACARDAGKVTLPGTMLSDTSPEATEFLVAHLRELPVWRKVRMVVELTQACQELARAGVLRRYPDASEREVRLRVAALWIDRDTMIEAFGWDPEIHGY